MQLWHDISGPVQCLFHCARAHIINIEVRRCNRSTIKWKNIKVFLRCSHRWSEMFPTLFTSIEIRILEHGPGIYLTLIEVFISFFNFSGNNACWWKTNQRHLGYSSISASASAFLHRCNETCNRCRICNVSSRLNCNTVKWLHGWHLAKFTMMGGKSLSLFLSLSICLSLCIFWVSALTQLHFNSYQLPGRFTAPQEWRHTEILQSLSLLPGPIRVEFIPDIYFILSLFRIRIENHIMHQVSLDK